MNPLRLAALAFFLPALPSIASAHIGLEPQAIDLVHAPGSTSPMDVENSFAFFSNQSGTDWRFSCHEALLGDPTQTSNQLPRYARSSDALLVTQRALGLGFDPNVDVYRSVDGGCDWTPVAGLDGLTVSQLAVLDDGTTVLAAATSGGLARSTDGGATFSFVGSVSPGDQALTVRAGAGAVAWASSLGPGGATLHVSTDGGSNWTDTPFDFETGSGALENLAVLMVDPADGTRAWVQVTANNLNTVLEVTDSGSTNATLFTDGRPTLDGAARGDSRMLTRNQSRILEWDGNAFAARADLPLAEGVALTADGLYIAANLAEDFMMAREVGGTVTPLLSIPDIVAELDCPAASRHAQVCSALWPDAEAVLRSYSGGSGDDDDTAGDDDDTVGKCQSNLGGGRGGLALLLLLPLLGRRRR